jgi:citrate lyase beta subunit
VSSKPLIALLFVPASDKAKLEKLGTLPGSGVILDLEDAVARSAKSQARVNAAGTIAAHTGDAQIWVRVNPESSGLLESDLNAVVQPGIAGIDIPKVESPDQILHVSDIIEQLEFDTRMSPGSIRIMATIETALGVGRVDEIAGVASPRLECLGFGTGDFCLDIGIDTDPESPTVIAAKVAVVLASRRARLHPPHDSVYINFDDPAGLEADTLRGKRLGFLGKHAIHPSQISIIERVYLPTPAEVERARRIVETFEAAEQAGQAAIGFNGELVDYPLAERSRRLLALAGDMSPAEKSQ